MWRNLLVKIPKALVSARLGCLNKKKENEKWIKTFKSNGRLVSVTYEVNGVMVGQAKPNLTERKIRGITYEGGRGYDGTFSQTKEDIS